MKDDKIVKGEVFSLKELLDAGSFATIVQTACEEFDIPTPLILSSHLAHYTNFNHCVFLPRDFVEPFFHDKLILENASD